MIMYCICINFQGINISWVKFGGGKGIFVVQGIHENLLSTKILMPLKQDRCGRGKASGVRESAIACVSKPGTTHDRYTTEWERMGE